MFYLFPEILTYPTLHVLLHGWLSFSPTLCALTRPRAGGPFFPNKILQKKLNNGTPSKLLYCAIKMIQLTKRLHHRLNQHFFSSALLSLLSAARRRHDIRTVNWITLDRIASMLTDTHMSHSLKHIINVGKKCLMMMVVV